MKTRRPTNISRSSAKHVRGCISSTEKPVSCWARRTTAFRLGAIDGPKSGTGSIRRWIGWPSHSDKGVESNTHRFRLRRPSAAAGCADGPFLYRDRSRASRCWRRISSISSSICVSWSSITSWNSCLVFMAGLPVLAPRATVSLGRIRRP
jgi:hypothetical protein